MKRASVILTGLVLFCFLTVTKSFAQADDVYYDPNNDKSSQQNNQNNYTNPNPQTDEYGNPADKYTNANPNNSSSYGDGNGNTYITNNYYDEDDYYATRLRRFYTPGCGLSYYSYFYTPSFYWGLGGISLSFGTPWYADPWWRWNRWNSFAYDPWTSPYWGWNYGWGISGYYHSWYSPGFCGHGYGYPYYGGGYYGFYNHGGYYSGYSYNHGYYNGNNYYGPRHNYGFAETNNTMNHHGKVNSNGNSSPAMQQPNSIRGREFQNAEIPKSGISKPFNEANQRGGKSRYAPEKSATTVTPPNANINPQQNNGWKSTPPAGWNNNNAKKNNQPVTRGHYPGTQRNNNSPQQQNYPAQQRNENRNQYREQRQMEQPRNIEPQRNIQQPRNIQQRNYNQAPHFEQRSVSPSFHSNNGGGGGGFRSSGGGGSRGGRH